jgi:DNA-binding MarR family transcriptional regulator
MAPRRRENNASVNPEPFLQLDRVIHEKGRLALMAALAATPELAFTELRDLLQMTDGNLTTHIRTLQESGYVAVTKAYRANRPLTTCSLTPNGRGAFTAHIALLAEIVAQAQRS